VLFRLEVVYSWHRVEKATTDIHEIFVRMTCLIAGTSPNRAALLLFSHSRPKNERPWFGVDGLHSAVPTKESAKTGQSL